MKYKAVFTLLALSLLSLLSACSHTNALQQAVESDIRSVDHVARDLYRNPYETLAFFEVEPSMHVVEVWPGKGWYTEVLAPLLSESGLLYAAHFAEDSTVPYFKKSRYRFIDKMSANPVYQQVKLTTLQPPKHLSIAPEGSVDRVLTFRNVHNWMKSGHEDQVFQAFFRVLKPGGILGVVEHRLPADRDQDPRAVSGYVTEAKVIEMAIKAGFKLQAKSEINANAKDSADHPKGVWTLPPSLRLKGQDKEKYLSIGESDRMTLKFVKPN